MEKIICVFGASIVYGAYDKEKGGWVNRLRIYLDNKDGFEVEVYNLGVQGDTTSKLLKRFNVEATERKPDIIIFSIGTNDSTQLIKENRNWIPIGEFESNLEELFSKAKIYAKEIVFVGIMPVDESKTSPISWNTNVIYKNSNIENYNRKTKEICEKEGIKFIDLYSEMIRIDYKKFLYDGLHPNSEGHEWIADKIIEELDL